MPSETCFSPNPNSDDEMIWECVIWNVGSRGVCWDVIAAAVTATAAAAAAAAPDARGPGLGLPDEKMTAPNYS